MTTKIRRDSSILDACESCHGYATGAVEFLNLSHIRALVSFLEERLDGWKPSSGAMAAEYDPIVKTLATVALAQAKSVLAKEAQ